MSTDIALVGAPNTDTLGFASGAAYVFEKTALGWIETASLVGSDTNAEDFFGAAVDISGDTLVVGASKAAGLDFETGAVYVFEKLGGSWTETAKIFASDGDNLDHFGTAVALDGDRLAIGAPAKDAGAVIQVGGVYVFERTGSQWVESAILQPNFLLGIFSFFGQDVDLCGDTLAAGAYADEISFLFRAGSVFVFERTPTGWQLQENIIASDPDKFSQFGWSLSLLGSTLAVGAPHDEADDSGSVYVFEFQGAGWLETAKIRPSDVEAGDEFGRDIALAQGSLVVGAPREDTNGPDAGSAYLFNQAGQVWSESYKLSISVANDLFGISVARTGDDFIVGARLASGFSGAAYVIDKRACLGTTLCAGVPNTTGGPAGLVGLGSDLAGENDFELLATDMPRNRLAYLLAGQGQGVFTPPGSAGTICIAGADIGRFVSQAQTTGQGGTIQIPIDLSSLPTNPPTAVMAGETWNFQGWYRDGTTSNFTEAISVAFQ